LNKTIVANWKYLAHMRGTTCSLNSGKSWSEYNGAFDAETQKRRESKIIALV
jgi:hypothetical protein